MIKLPVVSGKQVIKALQKIGYYIRDQKGSHIHIRHPNKIRLQFPIIKKLLKARYELFYLMLV